MNTRRTWALRRGLAAVVAGGLFLAGCGGGTTSSQATPPQTQQVPAAQAQPPADSTQSAPAGTSATPAAAATAAPSSNPMVQEHETGAEVTLAEAKRTGGDSLTVKWRYRNTSSGDVKLSKGGTSWLDTYQLTSEAFLVDPINKKKYLVITDDQRYPLASKHGDWQGVTLAPGQALNAWAKFPAPPADVEKVTVTIPGVPPFEDVPIIK